MNTFHSPPPAPGDARLLLILHRAGRPIAAVKMHSIPAQPEIMVCVTAMTVEDFVADLRNEYGYLDFTPRVFRDVPSEESALFWSTPGPDGKVIHVLWVNRATVAYEIFSSPTWLRRAFGLNRPVIELNPWRGSWM